MTLLRRRLRIPALCFLLAAVLPLLSSCYVPDRFRAEIRIARNGDFSMTYDGVLTWAPLYMDIRDGRVKGPEIQDKIESIRKDLKRDPQFLDVRSLGAGQFAVKYKRTGNLATNTGLITFVRRNARIIDIDSRANGRVGVMAQTPNAEKFKPLADAGLTIRGSLRVMSDMRLAGPHNATAVYADKESGWTVYDWIIDGSKPVFPEIVFQR
jgi:hypothetical protein